MFSRQTQQIEISIGFFRLGWNGTYKSEIENKSLFIFSVGKLKFINKDYALIFVSKHLKLLRQHV